MIVESIGVLTDEMISPRLADMMRIRGYDVLSCHAIGRTNLGISDDDQLAYAASQGRAFYTFNAADFRRLHARWSAAGLEHAGIILSSDLNRNMAEMIRRLQHHIDTVSASTQRNRVLRLGA